MSLEKENEEIVSNFKNRNLMIVLNLMKWNESKMKLNEI